MELYNSTWPGNQICYDLLTNSRTHVMVFENTSSSIAAEIKFSRSGIEEQLQNDTVFAPQYMSKIS